MYGSQPERRLPVSVEVSSWPDSLEAMLNMTGSRSLAEGIPVQGWRYTAIIANFASD